MAEYLLVHPAMSVARRVAESIGKPGRDAEVMRALVMPKTRTPDQVLVLALFRQSL